MQAPTAVANFPREIVNFPRSWVQKQYNLKQWSVFDSGVHRQTAVLVHQTACSQAGQCSDEVDAVLCPQEDTLPPWRSLMCSWRTCASSSARGTESR